MNFCSYVLYKCTILFTFVVLLSFILGYLVSNCRLQRGCRLHLNCMHLYHVIDLWIFKYWNKRVGYPTLLKFFFDYNFFKYLLTLRTFFYCSTSDPCSKNLQNKSENLIWGYLREYGALHYMTKCQAKPQVIDSIHRV